MIADETTRMNVKCCGCQIDIDISIYSYKRAHREGRTTFKCKKCIFADRGKEWQEDGKSTNWNPSGRTVNKFTPAVLSFWKFDITDGRLPNKTVISGTCLTCGQVATKPIRHFYDCTDRAGHGCQNCFDSQKKCHQPKPTPLICAGS